MRKLSYFICDESGQIITFFNNSAIGVHKNSSFEALENILKSAIFDEDIKSIEVEQSVVSLSRFGQFNWYIGVGSHKEDYLQKSIKKTTINAIFSVLGFAVFILVAHSAHEFLRRKSDKKQQEYEYMLAHRSRILEVGELVSGINHQLKQPLNVTTLVISSTLNLSECDMLDKETLEENLRLCESSAELMNKTINIFRNFYRQNEDVTKFCLIGCIKNILHIVYVGLVKHDIVVDFNKRELEQLEVESVENFIQQILLVLIQNAKDAINAQDAAPKKIVIDILLEGEMVNIDVLDFGGGISQEVNESLFCEFKTSKKYDGSGIGLYFSKKLANDKLGGDLKLISHKNPTQFRLSFPRYQNHKA